MAHNLEIRDGAASMFYVGHPPWHKLGTELAGPATAAAAIRAARLDWTVSKVPLYATKPGSSMLVSDQFAVVRDDQWGKAECQVLGIVSKGYEPLQNAAAFSFFDPIVGKSAAIYHTAGALGNGERVWMLAKLPSQIVVVGDDVADKFLLLSNSFDGESAVQVKFTPVRVVCQNTLVLALSDGPTIRIAHTPNMQQRLDDARRLLGIVERGFTGLADTFRAMCKLTLDASKLDEYLAEVFPSPKDPDNEKAAKRIQHDRARASHLFVAGIGNNLPGVRRTLWAAYNGVTEWVDHGKTDQAGEKRLETVCFGEGYQAKARALRVAKAKIKAWAN